MHRAGPNDDPIHHLPGRPLPQEPEGEGSPSRAATTPRAAAVVVGGQHPVGLRVGRRGAPRRAAPADPPGRSGRPAASRSSSPPPPRAAARRSSPRPEPPATSSGPTAGGDSGGTTGGGTGEDTGSDSGTGSDSDEGGSSDGNRNPLGGLLG